MAVTQLRMGIPRVDELERLKQTPAYREPADFNEQFLARHAAALKQYGKHWGAHPFRLWSRRWEYPFAVSQLLQFAEQNPRMRVMDAGSGVTFLPYFICSRISNANFVCVDYDPGYAAMFDAINRSDPCGSRVSFKQAALQKLPLQDGELDAIVCISVLEHTDNYEQIIDEFLRAMRPGALFVLTFDVSLDGKFTLPRPQAQQLLRIIQSKFVIDDGVDLLRELDQMNESGVLTSDYVRDTEPELLPWTKPVRVYKAVQDLVQGKGWTGGFRSRTVFCCSVRKPTSEKKPTA